MNRIETDGLMGKRQQLHPDQPLPFGAVASFAAGVQDLNSASPHWNVD